MYDNDATHEKRDDVTRGIDPDEGRVSQERGSAGGGADRMSGTPTGETYDLSPDWEALADALESIGEDSLAAKARDEALSPPEVYNDAMPRLEAAGVSV